MAPTKYVWLVVPSYGVSSVKAYFNREDAEKAAAAEAMGATVFCYRFAGIVSD